MFERIPGQAHIIDYITSSKHEGRLAQTFLLSGQAGYGLFDVARAIATYILCQNPTKSDACGDCSNCKKMQLLQHPDFHLFFPTAKAGDTSAAYMKTFKEMVAELPYFDYSDWLEFLGDVNKNLNINKDIIKEINHAFSFKSFENGPRVYMVWGAEFLGNEGNKLLKVIEEPPEDAYVILLAENRQALLTTILSRCQLLMLKPLSTDDLLRANKLEPSDENVNKARLAKGDLRKMQGLTGAAMPNHHATWIDFLRMAFKGHPLELVEKSTELANNGKMFCRQYLLYGLDLTSQMLKCNVGIPTENDAAIEKLAQLLTIDQIDMIQRRLQKDYIHVNRNANLKLLITSLSLWIAELFRKTKKSHART